MPGRISFVALIALVTAAVPARGQSAMQITAGAIGASPLIKDAILDTRITQSVAPLIGVGVLIPTGGPYRLLLQARGAHTQLAGDDASSGESSPITAVTTVDVMAMLEGPIREDIRWRVGGGAIFYFPSDKVGVFQDGSTRRWILAGGITWRHPIAPTLSLLVAATVDYHQFTTDVLLAHGYARGQAVERYALQLGVERKF